ncbi:methyltransferase domain-containing protein [Candidatus Pelagibacter sp.]|uniref:class I SAM-dependent methyltransferase n=1 Tax=Candidatus Pelagibacter sp. TaxID=2024849 RepID=UPI003F825E7A
MKNNINFLDLGLQPLANNYLKKNQLNRKEKKYRLKIGINIGTKLVSINQPISSKLMFNNKYPYRSSMSKTMLKSFQNLAVLINKKFKPKKILEIGSNDGSFIKNFSKKKVIGIEPCSNVEKITKKKGFNTYPLYWNLKTAKKLLIKEGKVDLIYSANTISHIENLDEVFRSIDIILNDNGILIIEDPSLLECLKKNTYDQFYNEHIYVFSLIGLENVLKKHNFEIFHIQTLEIHGGSNRYFIKKRINKKKISSSVKDQKKKEMKYGINKISTYRKFAKRVKLSKKKLKKIFLKIILNDNKIIGYGVTAKSTTILNYCKIGNDLVSYFIDTTKAKQNKYTPGTKIPIFKYPGFIEKDIDFVFLGAWNFKKEIFKKEKNFIKRGGKFIIHTPTPKIL